MSSFFLGPILSYNNPTFSHITAATSIQPDSLGGKTELIVELVREGKIIRLRSTKSLFSETFRPKKKTNSFSVPPFTIPTLENLLSHTSRSLFLPLVCTETSSPAPQKVFLPFLSSRTFPSKILRDFSKPYFLLPIRNIPPPICSFDIATLFQFSCPPKIVFSTQIIRLNDWWLEAYY